MKIGALLLCLAGLASAGEPSFNSLTLREELQRFGVPTGDDATRLERLIERLDSDDFAERSASLRDLATIPLLPESVLRLADTHPVLEVRYRLRELRDNPVRIARGGEVLSDLMEEMVENETKGLTKELLEALPWAERAELLQLAEKSLLSTVDESDRELLIEAMEEGENSDEVRRIMVPSLVKVGGEGVGDALVIATKASNTRLRALAAVELAKMGQPEALRSFGDLLESEKLIDRWHAIAALREVTGQHFGYGPGGTPEQRAASVARWRDWLEMVGKRNSP